MTFDLTNGRWLNPPTSYTLTAERLTLTTEPHTDFWQRTYYGFRNDNAPALLFNLSHNFTLSVRVDFTYEKLFDQCGLILYLDSQNWFKASIEYENGQFARLGSVVTNSGYSDWATQDIAPPSRCWYRLSRRGPDFLLEAALDGDDYRQLRIFHLHKLGETTPEMGKSQPPQPAVGPVPVGLYACSPLASRFSATFSDCTLSACRWQAHAAEESHE